MLPFLFINLIIRYLGGKIEGEAMRQEGPNRWVIEVLYYGCIADIKEKQNMDGRVCCGDSGDCQWWLLRVRERGTMVVLLKRDEQF